MMVFFERGLQREDQWSSLAAPEHLSYGLKPLLADIRPLKTVSVCLHNNIKKVAPDDHSQCSLAHAQTMSAWRRHLGQVSGGTFHWPILLGTDLMSHRYLRVQTERKRVLDLIILQGI